MRSQVEKNKESLMEYIEKRAEKEITPELAVLLSNAMGAYTALCMVGQSEESGAGYAVKSANKPEPTMELDGDTEFERVIMTIPADRAHMVKITHIFNKHMEGLATVNRRAYNSIIEQLKEAAKS